MQQLAPTMDGIVTKAISLLIPLDVRLFQLILSRCLIMRIPEQRQLPADLYIAVRTILVSEVIISQRIFSPGMFSLSGPMAAVDGTILRSRLFKQTSQVLARQKMEHSMRHH